MDGEKVFTFLQTQGINLFRGLLVLVTHDQWEMELCSQLHLLSGGKLSPYTYTGDLQGLLRDLERP